jgi:hypothetical protein
MPNTKTNICPKPNCGRPESAHRWSRGKKLLICGNGHSWDPLEVAEKEKSKANGARERWLRFKSRGGQDPFSGIGI